MVLHTTTSFNVIPNGQVPGTPIQSWTGLGYAYPLQQVAVVTTPVATPPYWSFANNNLLPNPLGIPSAANQSANSASPLCHDDQRDPLIAEYGQFYVGDAYFPPLPSPPNAPKTYPKTYPRFTPNCFELAGAGPNSAHSANFDFDAISTNHPWALIKYPLVAPSSLGYGLDHYCPAKCRRESVG